MARVRNHVEGEGRRRRRDRQERRRTLSNRSGRTATSGRVSTKQLGFITTLLAIFSPPPPDVCDRVVDLLLPSSVDSLVSSVLHSDLSLVLPSPATNDELETVHYDKKNPFPTSRLTSSKPRPSASSASPPSSSSWSPKARP